MRKGSEAIQAEQCWRRPDRKRDERRGGGVRRERDDINQKNTFLNEFDKAKFKNKPD